MLLANAPTFAALTAMGTALLARGPEIADNVNSMIQQARGPLAEESGGTRLTAAVGALADIAPLAQPLAARSGVITDFLDSKILQPEIVDIIGRLGEAAMHADQVTRGSSATVGGVFALNRLLKEPEIQETLAFLVEFARFFGNEQRSASHDTGSTSSSAPASS
jgi:DNA-binding transcriptional LysR family regulator